MVETHGLNHISLRVKDPQRSVEFYTQVFGVREYYRDDEQIQVQGPGPFDVIAFVLSGARGSRGGGIDHFGFRLKKPEDIHAAIAEVQAAGGHIVRQGEFGPGLPYVYVHDPDGYEIEIWFE